MRWIRIYLKLSKGFQEQKGFKIKPKQPFLFKIKNGKKSEYSYNSQSKMRESDKGMTQSHCAPLCYTYN